MHSVAVTFTSAAYDFPLDRFIPSAGATPVWQPESAQLDVKMGWICAEKLTLAPHEHVPPLQSCPDGHAWPHDPQLFASVEVFVHAEPHAVSPVGQTHWLETHDAPVGHVVVQLPQWLGSVDVVTHVPLQFVLPDGH